MSYKNFKKAIELAKKCDGYLTGTGIPENVIKDAECKLNVQFSKQLTLYLTKNGFIEYDGCEIYGIIKTDFSAIPEGSIVESCMYYRKKNNLPRNWLPIYNYNDGYMAFLDYGDLNEEQEPKVIMGIYTGEQYEKTNNLAEDFGDFILSLVEEQLANQ
ncbi:MULTISPECIES: SMI1/KNR4 family protein [unclassified Breznakia]|uniref:SMI1/KNR4 family protein n=1 Tax=unclassified Breznakia TaxID=2623764 RepID=UPI002474D556|nr:MULTISPECIES: SMI1/KNR4 family protein [unclassified Breznakia]MDH6366901.1 hypothetical protein [Breznakia sp. PH1-1]MDH6404079.1 hypothetical protein [Breznakia sp. PF1-11]MDH6411699.1 hypothetical protein [Breznakia sp. PFB1-11]MDH6414067.1 hypothetical protein [Breznakia sp. PFB1-14]MDH6416497.1 hypothetical protein [Breznakia sp. PFB1-4]